MTFIHESHDKFAHGCLHKVITWFVHILIILHSTFYHQFIWKIQIKEKLNLNKINKNWILIHLNLHYNLRITTCAWTTNKPCTVCIPIPQNPSNSFLNFHLAHDHNRRTIPSFSSHDSSHKLTKISLISHTLTTSHTLYLT